MRSQKKISLFSLNEKRCYITRSLWPLQPMASHPARGAELIMIRVFDLSKAVSRALKSASTTVNPFTRCAVDPFVFYGGRGIEKKRGSKISITLHSSHEVMNILKPPKLIPSSRGFVEITKKRKNVGLEAGTHKRCIFGQRQLHHVQGHRVRSPRGSHGRRCFRITNCHQLFRQRRRTEGEIFCSVSFFWSC